METNKQSFFCALILAKRRRASSIRSGLDRTHFHKTAVNLIHKHNSYLEIFEHVHEFVVALVNLHFDARLQREKGRK
jgi:hypothetical protein